MLQLTDIEAIASAAPAFCAASIFEVPEKSVVCLMGRNGVGKTSTLKTIVGALKPNAGHGHARRRRSHAAAARGARARTASATSRKAAKSSRTSPSRKT